MSIVRSIEIIAQSPQGFDQACKEAIKEASKTLRGINSFWIKNAECIVENDQITMYRVNGKISFSSRREQVTELGGGRSVDHLRNGWTLGAGSPGNAYIARRHDNEFSGRQLVRALLQRLIEMLDLRLQLGPGKPEKQDAGVRKALVKNQLAEIAIGYDQDP